MKGFDPNQDALIMMEGALLQDGIHRKKAALMTASFRQFQADLEQRGCNPEYIEVPDAAAATFDLSASLNQAVERYTPEALVVTEPGDYTSMRTFKELETGSGPSVKILPNRLFFASKEDFASYARGRKQITLEYFYRGLRKRHEVLMEDEGAPAGGDWNYDSANRDTFKKSEGPPPVPEIPRFFEDEIRKKAIRAVDRWIPDNVGSLALSDQPTSPAEAEELLDHFLDNLLPTFGRYQDAIWNTEPFLFHSRLSFALNVGLLDPRRVVRAAESRYRDGSAPIAAVEGFVRQLLGWREYIRGVYWHLMPEYAEHNALEAREALPEFFWSGETEMNCVSSVVGDILSHGYAHHIQRLMVMGLYALLAGVDPVAFHRWHLALYVDAFDWVSLPNALGMSLYADGGIVGTKPYCASGNYINRMSNYCSDCRYNHKDATGEDACPFTVLYWDFLSRHEERFSDNPRMQFQLKNLRRKEPSEISEIRRRAEGLRSAS